MLGGIGPVLSLMAFLRYLWRPAGNHSAARAMGRPSARSTRGLTWVLGLQRPGLSETRTLRWRKQDSNFRFLVGPEYQLTTLGAIRPSGQSRGMPEMRLHSA